MFLNESTLQLSQEKVISVTSMKIKIHNTARRTYMYDFIVETET